VFVEQDAAGNPHAVFVHDAVRLQPPDTLTVLNDLTRERLQELFFQSQRELVLDDEAWRVSWDQIAGRAKTVTVFQSASGMKLVLQKRVMFPFMSESELAHELNTARATTVDGRH
jgi:hypothetical protein